MQDNNRFSKLIAFKKDWRFVLSKQYNDAIRNKVIYMKTKNS